MMQSVYGSLGGGGGGGDPLAAAAALAAMDPLMASKDTTFTKIFVGGLPYHTSDQTLKEYFEQYGEIDEAVVITDRQTGKSRGYGFVTMKDRTGAERACKDPNPIIDGRKANVNLAYLGAKPRGNLQLTGLPVPLQTAATLPGLLSPSHHAAAAAGRLGLSQLYYPTASPLMTSQGLVFPGLGGAGAGGAGGAAGQVAGGSPYFDYSALASAYAAAAAGGANGGILAGQQQAAAAAATSAYDLAAVNQQVAAAMNGGNGGQGGTNAAVAAAAAAAAYAPYLQQQQQQQQQQYAAAYTNPSVAAGGGGSNQSQAAAAALAALAAQHQQQNTFHQHNQGGAGDSIGRLQ